MRPLKVIIIDDEKNAVESIITVLKNFCENVEIAGFAFGSSDGIALAKKTKPDLIFVDIEMNDGTGFDVATALKDTPSLIVFVTAFEQYAIKAFKANAVDYILKPVAIEEIQQVVEKAHKRLQNHKLFEHVLERKPQSEKISIPTNKGLLFIELKDILLIEADGRYSKIHYLNSDTVFVSKNLGEIEKMLDPEMFFRVHHSSIVNLKHICELNTKEGGYIIMQGGTKVLLSRRKKDEFLKILKTNPAI